MRANQIISGLCILIYLLNAEARGGEVGVGVAALEEGDDRYRPATALHLGLGEHFLSRAYFYGRRIGPYKEWGSILEVSRKFSVFGNNSDFKGSWGGAILYELKTYDPEGDSGESSESHGSFNAGMKFGVAYECPIDLLFLSFNWDAHVFLAGSTGILLSTGRKQTLSIVSGVNF